MATMTIDQSRRFTFWARGEVWTGPSGTGDFVPNLGDLIFDGATDVLYKVTNVNYSTGISEWTQVSLGAIGGATEVDVLIGVGPGAASETWRIHASMEFTPFEASFDTRLNVYGSEAAYVKVFKEADFSVAANVISAIYDQNNQWVSDEVPVEGTGQVRALGKFYLKEEVEQGQPLYVQVYKADGSPLGSYRMLAHVTDYIPDGNLAIKHITGIEIVSKFLSETATDTLEVPKNIPLSSLVLTARVHYSGLPSMDYPIDGSKFSLLNIQPFTASIADQTFTFRLKYILGSDESGDGVFENNGERFVTKPYTMKVLPTDNSYSVKLMSFMDWDAANSKYKLLSYLYSLDRDESTNVSDLLVIGVTGDPFTGVPGGGELSHVLSVDMEDVNPAFSNFRHTQVLTAEAASVGTAGSVRWRVQNDENGVTLYDALVATVSNLTTQWGINLDSGFATLQDFLDATYLKQGPLFNSETEAGPLDPTHLRLVFGASSVQVPITDWNQQITFTISETFTEGRTVVAEFIRIEGPDTFLLGACGFTVNIV